MVSVVVPYRDRAPQLLRLLPRLEQIRNVQEIIIVEPQNKGPFNRGWVKNVGFLLANCKVVYFYDVDLLPGLAFHEFPLIHDRRCLHLYGHPHCYGGIVGFRAEDFDEVGGFVNNQLAWGGEDRYLRQVCEAANIRSTPTPKCLRFACDTYISEMDSRGYPQPGKKALLQFRQDLLAKNKIPAPPRSLAEAQGHLHSTQFVVVNQWKDKKYPKTCLYQVKNSG